jgi:pyrrolidone-carboxylate peptidase
MCQSKPRPAWNIVKTLTGNKINDKEVSQIKINNVLTDNCELIVNSFNMFLICNG